MITLYIFEYILVAQRPKALRLRSWFQTTTKTQILFCGSLFLSICGMAEGGTNINNRWLN